MKLIIPAILLTLVLLLPTGTESSYGVGVGKVEIAPREPLKGGEITYLGEIPVFNTGDEVANYSFFVTFQDTDLYLKPNPSWFSFEPKTFELQPKSSLPVKVYINIPSETTKGNYFAYLEARPTIEGASVGIAAATKLRFKFDPEASKLAGESVIDKFLPVVIFGSVFLGAFFIILSFILGKKNKILGKFMAR